MSVDTHGQKIHRGWIGVDLDGTLAHYQRWEGPLVIGDPIPKMVERVKRWLEEGHTVKIVTARVSPLSVSWNEVPKALIVSEIQIWCDEHIGKMLEVTHEKDALMLELWDDRAIQVVPNTGDALQDAVDRAAQIIATIGTTSAEEVETFKHARRWLRDFFPERCDPPYGAMIWEK